MWMLPSLWPPVWRVSLGCMTWTFGKLDRKTRSVEVALLRWNGGTMPSLNWNSFRFLGREGLDPGLGENEMAKTELNQSLRKKVDVCVCVHRYFIGSSLSYSVLIFIRKMWWGGYTRVSITGQYLRFKTTSSGTANSVPWQHRAQHQLKIPP